MNAGQFKKLIYQELARVGKCLSDPARLEILDMALQAPKHVEQLCLETKRSMATVSHHLQILKQAGLLESARQGRFITYAGTPLGRALFARLCAEAEQSVASIQVAMQDFFSAETEAVDERGLLDRAQNGEILLIDVRPQHEYEAGHLPGAVSVPLREIRGKLRKLPRNREIFAYCRGRYCVLSQEATTLLRKWGYRVHRMESGPLDFEARGVRLEAAG